MNFFKEQTKAKQKTKLLIFLILLGFLLTAIAINALVIGIWYLVLYFQLGASQYLIEKHDIWHGYMVPAIPYVCAVTTLVFVLIALVTSFLKSRQLKRGGGHYVAAALGGRMLQYEASTALERQLLNIVEEMAIASGLSVPAVYVMDEEEGINAFAAGFTSKDTVVAVTRGCLQKLDREALQGVVAHEFSHILHGDVRLNLRLVGLMHGLLVIGLTGFIIMRLVFKPRYSVRAHQKKDQGGPYLIAVFLLGLGLAVVGYIGHFFGILIRAAVSRQREYLADASAVQFTRDPSTIGKALKQIAWEQAGSKLYAADAAEYSHTYFAQGVTSWLGRLTATHPPLRSRIKAIDPRWDGSLESQKRRPQEKKPEKELHTKAKNALGTIFTPQMLLQEMGHLTWGYMMSVQADLGKLPKPLVRYAHCAYEGRALVYALLLSREEARAAQQTKALRSYMDPKVEACFEEVYQAIKHLHRNERLSLARLSVTGLRQLSKRQFHQMLNNCERIIAWDETADIFEWSLAQVILAPLHAQFEKEILTRERTIQSDMHHVQYLLNVLADYGDTKQKSLQHVCEALEIAYIDIPQPQLTTLAASLPYLMTLCSEDKQKLLSACIVLIQHDGNITDQEAQLLRSLCLILDCPMAPLV